MRFLTKRPARLAMAVAAAAVAATISAAPGSAETTNYVALGDSAAAGPSIPPTDVSNLACGRSLANYPHVLAKRLSANLTDVTCSGGTTISLPTQYGALNDKTDLVTLTVGGNDVDLVGAALGCLNVLPEPNGVSCAERLTAGGRDQLAEKVNAWTPHWTSAVRTIKQKAPNAQVYVVGYGTYLPKGGCFGKIPAWGRDSDYIQASITKMNQGLASAARANGAHFVDLEPSTVGHTVCEAPNVRYYEPLVPGNPASPMHPNAAGMVNASTQIAKAIGSNSR